VALKCTFLTCLLHFPNRMHQPERINLNATNRMHQTRNQGETNADYPNRYARCLPAMIRHWRQSFSDTTNRTPFVFTQIGTWPDGDSGIIPSMRYAQRAALQLPAVGMVVSADIGDPAGVYHPIHPPFKQEVGRRTALCTSGAITGHLQEQCSNREHRGCRVSKCT
jgi:hypothetical protein